MASEFLKTKLPETASGVMQSWPGVFLSVRLTNAIIASGFESWSEILNDPDNFAQSPGIGSGCLEEVQDLFLSIGKTFLA